MPERVKLALIGCGGMGRRHLRGIDRLSQSSMANLDLVAVCDLNDENAQYLADEAKELLGTRPRVFTTWSRWSGKSATSEPPASRRMPSPTTRWRRPPGARAQRPVREADRRDDARRQSHHRRREEGRPRPVRGRELPPRSDQPPGKGAADGRRHRDAPPDDRDEHRRTGQHPDHPVAPHEAHRVDHAGRGRPQRRHPPLLHGRVQDRLRSLPAAREDPEEHRLDRPRRLLRPLVRQLPGHHRADRRGRAVRVRRVRERRLGPVDSGSRGARSAESGAPRLRLKRLAGVPRRPQRPADQAPPGRRHGHRGRAHPGVRTKLQARTAGRRAVRGRAHLDLQPGLQRHRQPHPGARILRARRSAR